MADFIKTLYQVLLAGLIGGLLAYAWQRRGWIFQQNLKIATDKHEAQLQLIKDFFSLVDRRIFASRLYLDELILQDDKRITQQRDSYRTVVTEWNERAPGLLVLIRGRFDAQISLDFEHYFLPAFTEVDSKLRRKRLMDATNQDQQDLTNAIKGNLHLINYRARDQMQTLFQKTKRTLVLLETKPQIDLYNFDSLSLPYLIKSLFIPRRQS